MDTKKIVRRNAIFMVLEGALFYTTLALIPTETVIAQFIDFTSGKVALVGLAATLSSLMFYVGEFICGLFIHRIRSQRRFMIRVAFVYRSLLLLFALALSAGLKGPAAAWLVVLLYGVIFVLDGFVGLCWNQILARTMPLEKRGIVLSLQQSVCGGVGVLVGFVLQRILLSDMAKMAQFRLIFFLAGCVFLLSGVMMLFFMDVPHESHPEVPVKTPVTYIREILPLVTKNRGVRQAILGKVLFTLTMISSPVNYKFGQMCGLSDVELSALVYMPVAGQILAGFFWSQVSKRTNYPTMMLLAQIAGILCAAANFAALALHLTGHSVMIALSAAMLLIKFTYVAGNAFNQHVIAILDPSQTANGIVLTSILTAPATLGTTLAGAIADWAFWPVYAIMLAAGVVGAYLCWRCFISKNSPLPENQRLRRK